MNYKIIHKEHGGHRNPELNLPELTTEIGLEQVEEVYVGKGNSCRCGCGGTYFKVAEDPKAIKKIKHYLKKMASGEYKVESLNNYIFEIIISERYSERGRLTNQRVATIYLNEPKEEGSK